MQRLKSEQKIDDGSFEVGRAINANAAGERAGCASDGRDAEGFVLRAAAMGDKSFGRRKILEVHGQPAADDVHSHGSKNSFPRHRRIVARPAARRLLHSVALDFQSVQFEFVAQSAIF